MKKAFLIILCCCLLVTTAFAPITKAQAMAGTLAVGIGVVAFVAGALGLTFATQGDFRQACQACFNAMPKDMKDFIEANTIYDADLQKLKLTALVTQAYFKEVFQNIVDFFKGDTITVVEPGTVNFLAYDEVIHVNSSNILGDIKSYISQHPISNSAKFPYTSDWNLYFTSSYGAIEVKYIKLTNTNGQLIYYNTAGYPLIQSSLPETTNYIFFLAVDDGTYTRLVPCYDTKNGLELTWLSSIVFNITGQSFSDTNKDIFIHDTPGAIDAGVVLDGMQTAGESEAGLVLDIPTVGVLDEVYGDDTTAENAYTGTQSGTLSQSGVISNIDTTLNPVLDDYKAETEINGQRVGLGDVFPFCIPFDIYDMLKGLAANRQAPHFEWNLKYKDLVDYTFVIDFEQFETVAVVLRTLELLAFCVGLAFVTRHLLRS